MPTSITLIPPDSLATTQALTLQLHPRGDLAVSATLRETGRWESFESELLCQLLDKGDCLLDVGANIGYFTVLGASAVGSSGRVIAFEPEPRNYALLEQNITDNKLSQVIAVNAALGQDCGAIKLHLSEDNWGDHQIYDRGQGRDVVEVELLNGDQALQAQSANPALNNEALQVKLIKVDTQGAEYGVLRGLEQTIAASLPGLRLIVEFWPFGLKRAGSHGHELLDLLCSYQLPIWNIDHQNEKLVAMSEQQLRNWVNLLDVESDNEGFFNLLLGEPPAGMHN